ncbi:unnamed protein product [Aphanomyces euteiches]|nr:hypothetical protein AeRB84_012037 [Aphanomyces euteiches]
MTSSVVGPIVLTSKPLFRCICDFQHGVYHDMLPFLQFSVVQSQNLLQYAIQVEAELLATVQPWLQEFGLARLDRLMATLPFMRSIILLYGARVGDCEMLETIARIAGVQSIELLTNLLNIAIASSHTQVIESLRRLGYTPENYIGHLFCGMGEAIAASNMAMAQFLDRDLSKVDQVTLQSWFELDQLDRRRMTTTLKHLVNANQGDSLAWLLQTWSKFANVIQMNQVRAYWRRLALELSKWTLLSSVEDPQKSLKALFTDDLRDALRIPSLPAVHWLVQQGCPVHFDHITDVSRAWSYKDELDVLIDIFDYLWAVWLDHGASADEMKTALYISNEYAWHTNSVRAIDSVWSKRGKPPIRNFIDAARNGSSLKVVDFAYHRLKLSMPVDKFMAMEIEALLAAIRSNQIHYVEWWLNHVELQSQDTVDAVLQATNENKIKPEIRQLVESKCKSWLTD